MSRNVTWSIIDPFAESQGWDDSTITELLVSYIDNQGDSLALRDFLQDVADEENEGRDE